MNKNNKGVTVNKFHFGVAVAILLFHGNNYAAGFDCKKATTAIEKEICADAEISVLDEQMTKKYRKLMGKLEPKEKAVLSGEQRYWLRYQRTEPLHEEETGWAEGYRAKDENISRLVLKARYEKRNADMDLKLKMIDGSFRHILTGTYLVQNSYMMMPALDEEPIVIPVMDSLNIKMLPDRNLYLNIQTTGGNSRRCLLDGNAVKQQDGSFMYSGSDEPGEPPCKVHVAVKEKVIEITSSGQCHNFCGDGAGIDSEFSLIGIISVK